jgi:hypothetical protein
MTEDSTMSPARATAAACAAPWQALELREIHDARGIAQAIGAEQPTACQAMISRTVVATPP